MKKLIYTLPLMALGLLASCSNDDVTTPEPQPVPGEGQYYFTMNLTVPTSATEAGTRADNNSTTTNDGVSSDGYLAGGTNECNVTSVDIYFIQKNDSQVVLVKSFTPEEDTSSQASGSVDKIYKISANITNSLADLIPLLGKDLYIVAVCNASSPILGSDFKLTTTDKALGKELPAFSNSSNILGDYGTGGNGKTMVMASAQTVSMDVYKDKTKSESDNAANLSNIRNGFSKEGDNYVLNLGTIDVERVVARLDLKDSGSNWVYTIEDGDNGQTGIKIKMATIQPFNINTKSYVFKHTAADNGSSTAATGTLTLLGKEGGTPYNWVADPSWGTSNYSKNATFINTLSGEKGTITSTNGFTATNIDNNTGGLLKHTPVGDYYPWMYVTENTLNNTSLMTSSALATKATGVLFSFQIMDKNGTAPITKSGTETLPNEIRRSGDNIILILPISGTEMTVEPTDNNYYLNYYGYVTHNYSDAAGPMKYGVVRNNVYRMSVGSIKSLPDGSSSNYLINLKINVLKWNVRNVQFDW